MRTTSSGQPAESSRNDEQRGQGTRNGEQVPLSDSVRRSPHCAQDRPRKSCSVEGGAKDQINSNYGSRGAEKPERREKSCRAQLKPLPGSRHHPREVLEQVAAVVRTGGGLGM